MFILSIFVYIGPEKPRWGVANYVYIYIYILTRACAEIKILRSFFFAFPFSPFLFFLLQWLTFYWACLRLKNFKTNFSVFFAPMFWAFLCISQAPYGRSLWSGHHWKDLLLLQKLSIDQWCQFCSKVMTSEVEERPRLGRHGSQWVFASTNLTNAAPAVPHSPN